MTMFAIQEGIVNTCESAVEAYGLKALKGSDGSVDVKESVKDMTTGYKIGSDLTFTATFKATYDPEKRSEEPEEEVVDADVVDAEVVEAETEAETEAEAETEVKEEESKE